MADRRIGKTKTAIRDAYMKLLTGGHGKITVSEIARLANIDRKTFYLHYDTPDAVLEEIYDGAISEAVSLGMEKDPSDDIYDNINGLFELMTAMIAKKLDIFEAVTERGREAALFDKLRTILIDQLHHNYADVIDLSETEYKVYSEFFMTGIIAVYRLWISQKMPLSIDELSRMVTRVSLKGLEGIVAEKEGVSC